VAGTGVAGAKELAAQLTAGAARVEELMAVVVEKSAHDMVAAVQRHASGRPGPNAPTGDYRGSWNALPTHEGVAGGVSWSVGTDRAQAARLEYGFVGPDSLGRVFHQDPLPHMGPAYDEIAPVFEAAMDAVAAKALPR
jgi:hypothetical protein